MKVKAVAHVCIKTTNLKLTEDFYLGVLGMERVFNFTRRGSVIGFYMKAAGETFIEVFAAGEARNEADPVLSHICLLTDDIKALRQRVADQGFAPGEVIMGADNSWQFWMCDPNGMAIEFHEYTDISSQLTGRDVEATW
jgi:lactoylglutathione lyase/glyoxylase I family protein